MLIYDNMFIINVFIYSDTSHNLLGIDIYIKVTISAWAIIRRYFEEIILE